MSDKDAAHAFYIHAALDLADEGKGSTESGVMSVAGFASTRGLDEVGDVVEPSAFKETLPGFLEFPNLFFAHDMREPIGAVRDAEITAEGLEIRADILPTTRGKDVQTLVRAGALKAFSIGYHASDTDYDPETGIRRIKKLQLFEISIVPLPANRSATFEIARQVKAWRATVPGEEPGKGVTGDAEGRPPEAVETLRAALLAGASAVGSNRRGLAAAVESLGASF